MRRASIRTASIRRVRVCDFRIRGVGISRFKPPRIGNLIGRVTGKEAKN